MNESGFQWISWNVRRTHPVVVVNKCLVRDSLLQKCNNPGDCYWEGVNLRYPCLFQEFFHDLWDTSRSSDLILATALVGEVRSTQQKQQEKMYFMTPKWPPKSPPILQRMVTMSIFGAFSLVSSVFPFGNMEILSWRRTPCVWPQLFGVVFGPNTLRWLFRRNLKKKTGDFLRGDKGHVGFFGEGFEVFPEEPKVLKRDVFGVRMKPDIFFHLVWRWCYTTRQLPICYIRYLVQMYDMPAKLIPNKNI